MRKNYAIAWMCLLECLRKNISLEIWIAPIPEEHKKKMVEAGRRFIERERLSKREPFLFEEA